MRLHTERRRKLKGTEVIKPVEDAPIEFDYERDVPQELRQRMELYSEEIIHGFQGINDIENLRQAVDFLQAIGKDPKFDREKLREVCDAWKETAYVRMDWLDDQTEKLLAFLEVDHSLRSRLQPLIQKASESLSLEQLRQYQEQPFGTTLRSLCMYGVMLLPEYRQDYYALADQWVPGHLKRLQAEYNGALFLKHLRRIAYGRFAAPHQAAKYQDLVRPQIHNLIRYIRIQEWTCTRYSKDIDYEKLDKEHRIQLLSAVASLIQIFAHRFEIEDDGRIILEPKKSALSQSPELPPRLLAV